ncbi:hypothetical protein, partial [uncultured Microscilla sp.]|uniref:hypothetical protein n=1 Tax=uncultured Microscilla sp. TaxID=432653 RepID=UPI002636D2F8
MLIGDAIAPTDYKNKFFAGNLFKQAYLAIMEGWGPDNDYTCFYADSAALDQLRKDTGKANEQWSL